MDQGSCLCPGADEGVQKEMGKAGWGVSGLGHTGLLGRAIAKTLGLLPSKRARRPSLSKESLRERVREEQEGATWSEEEGEYRFLLLPCTDASHR